MQCETMDNLEKYTCSFISKVKQAPEPLAEVKPVEEEVWVGADGRGAAAPRVVRQL